MISLFRLFTTTVLLLLLLCAVFITYCIKDFLVVVMMIQL